ncbi:MAG: MATE family efflux transporter [Spirochaetales bacterium]|nr:MATE family efflux transporter [Spirochaetales bacterium]
MKKAIDFRVLKLALPTIVSQISLTLVQVVDMAFIGRLGPFPLAAVGIIITLLWVIQAASQGWGVGLTAIIARMEGQRDFSSLRIFFRTGILSVLAMGILLLPFLYFFRQHLFQLINTPHEVLPYCEEYYLAIIGFLPFSFAFESFNAYFRARGDSFTPMAAGLAMNLANILFDWLLVFGVAGFPALGIAGAALASGISYIVGCLVLFFRSCKEIMNLEKLKDIYRLSYFYRIFAVSNAAVVERLAMSISQLGVLTIAVNPMGGKSIAAFNIVMRLASLSFMPGFGFAISASALTGQSLGEKQPEMARRYIWRSAFYCALIMIAISLLYYFLADPLFSIFTQDPVVVELARPALQVYAIFAVFLSPTMVFGGGLRGAGDTRFSMYTMLLSRFVFRLPLAWLFGITLGYGLAGVWFAMCFDFFFRAIVFWIRLRQGKWQHLQV